MIRKFSNQLIKQQNNPNNYRIRLYTDGGSRNSGNKHSGHVRPTDKSAWAYLIILPDGTQHGGSGGQYGATNNQMELLGLLKGLERLLALGLNKQPLEIISDSQYVVDSLKLHRIVKWNNNDWHYKSGRTVANYAYWKQIIAKIVLFSNVELHWVRGHANNQGNDFVDKLVNKTMDSM